jgi:hypothetical protein
MEIINLEKRESRCPIELIEWFDGTAWVKDNSNPNNYERLVLLSTNYKGRGYDLIMAYVGGACALHKGHFNSGTV